MISVGVSEAASSPAEKDKARSFFSRLFTKQKKMVVKSPASTSTKSTESTPKRRFVRVVRDNERAGEEYENPHVIRRYTKNYWEENNTRMACSLDDSRGPLPYTVSGHTILKKHSFEDGNSFAQKKATFSSEVEIIMFNRLEKMGVCQRMTRSMPLMNFNDDLHNDDSKLPIELDLASGEEDDCAVPDELVDECERREQDVAEEQEQESAGSDVEQASTDFTAAAGRFALLVAADEKDMHVNRAKRKLSTSSGSSEGSCQIALEA